MKNNLLFKIHKFCAADDKVNKIASANKNLESSYL